MFAGEHGRECCGARPSVKALWNSFDTAASDAQESADWVLLHYVGTMVLRMSEDVFWKVYVVDIQPKRLEKALALGATGVIDAKTENTLERLKELSEGLGFDLAIETAGSTITSQQSFYAVKKGGTVVLVGYNVDALVPLPVNHALDNEITVKTIFRYRHIYPLAIDAVASGKVDLKGLVTNLFNFDDIQRALRESIENKVEIVKAAIRM